jgi:hypothetical protein
LSRKLVVFVFATALLTLSTEALGQASCSYDATSHAVSIQTEKGPPEANFFGQSTLSLVGDQIRFDGQLCEGATLTNTDSISVTGVPEAEAFYVSGIFAPGFSPESDGEPEIEIHVDLGGGSINPFGISGTVGPDHLTLGTLGASINLDNDVDVTVTGNEIDAFLSGRESDDVLSARGGFGAGGPTTDSVALGGDAGADRILDGLSGDGLHGGAGRDVLAAGKGNDLLTGSGKADRLRGGPGKDLLIGGAGKDVCRPGPGRDTTERCERPLSLFGNS